MNSVDKTKKFFNKSRAQKKIDQSPIELYVYQEICKKIPKNLSNSIALDVGCHWGKYATYLASFFDSVVGVDFAESAIKSAYQRDNIQYLCLDIEKEFSRLLGYSGSVDLINVICVYEMLISPKELTQNLYKLSRVGGKVFVVIPNRNSLNYLSLRLYMWLTRVLFFKKHYIWNNGIDLTQLRDFLIRSGYTIQSEGQFISLPIYLVGRFPRRVQNFLIKFDSMFKPFFGCAYSWVVARK